MGKKLKHRMRQRRSKFEVKQPPSLVLFILVGGLSDILWAINTLVHVGAWPFHQVSKFIARNAKKHPGLRILHSHAFVGVIIGLLTVVASFAFADLFHNLIWQASMETARAAGVCPIWDTVSGLAKISSELEG